MTVFKSKQTNILYYVLITVAMIAAATGIGWIFRRIGFPETNIVIVYLLSILITARLTKGYAYGIIASIIAICAFNYFFTKPYYTFSVNDPAYLITFAIMTVTAFITSALTSKVKQNALEAQEREAEASALFQLTNRLTDAADIYDIAGITTETISGIMNCRAACLCFDESGQPEQSFIQQQSAEKQVRRKVDSVFEIRHRIEGLRTAYDVGEEFYDWPIYGRAEMLMYMTDNADPRYSLAQGIQKDADWLHSLVENILSLTRLQDGKLTITKQPEAAEEVIGGAISHFMKRYPEYEITVSVPEEVLIVPMDAKLIEQVMINLLDNAIKHSPPDCEINVSASKVKDIAIFSVADRGSGIAVSDLPNIFQMFYTTHSGEADAQRGVGLGLAICEAIVKAHGGTIEGHNRTDGQGAEFVFTLPTEVKNYGE